MARVTPALARIEAALGAAAAALVKYRPGAVQADRKENFDPVTAADVEIDALLRETLQRPGEGWLSEETADDPSRLALERVWVVDPLDGTKEFVEGLPEWCVSVALVEAGQVVAAGVTNPAAGFTALGAAGVGCWLNSARVAPTESRDASTCHVLASRSEVRRGEWRQWDGSSVRVEAMGSVAYKLARVACGLADATWTLVPKHEWDIAAGVGLIEAAGGWARTTEGRGPVFNQPHPWLPGLIAGAPGLASSLTYEFVSQNGEARQ